MKRLIPYIAIIHMTVILVPLLFIDWRSAALICLVPLCLYIMTIKQQRYPIGLIAACIVILSLIIHDMSLIYLILLSLLVIIYFMTTDVPLLLYIQLLYGVHVIFNDHLNLLAVAYVCHMVTMIVLSFIGRSMKDFIYKLQYFGLPVVILLLAFAAVRIIYPFVIEQIPVDFIREFKFDIKPIDDPEKVEKIEKMRGEQREMQLPESEPTVNHSLYYLVAFGLLTAALIVWKLRGNEMPRIEFRPAPQVITHEFKQTEFQFESSLPKNYMRQFKKLERTGRRYDIHFSADDTFNDYLSRYPDSAQLMSLFNEIRYADHAPDNSQSVKQEVTKTILLLKQSDE